MSNLPDELASSDRRSGDISKEAVEAQVRRILESARFAGSPQLRSLLSYLVAQHLAGNEAALKEVVVGAIVFGKPADYDPQGESIVRTTAQRLRVALSAYYDRDGREDPIIIALPKGHYLPQFARRNRVEDPLVVSAESVASVPRPRLSGWSWAAGFVCVAIVGFMGNIVVSNLRDRVIAGSPLAPNIGRLFAYSTSEGRNPIRLNLGYQVGSLIVTPDGSSLYAIELYGRRVTLLGVDDLQVKKRFQLPHPARGAVISSNGKRLYIGSPDSLVMILETEHGNVERLIETARPVFDLSATPDETKIFVALGSAGLKRIAMPSGDITTLSVFACPLFLAMGRDGKRLIVSYQCGGPSGRAGHDAVEIYDTTSERTVRVIRDLPMVGGPPRVSPDGSLLLLDGLDACVTKTYDRVGCPAVGVGHVFHLVRLSDGSVMKSFIRPTNTLDAAFSPDGGRLVFGGDPLVVIDWARQMVTEVAPVQGRAYNFLAFSPSGGRAFAASFESSDEILVFDPEKRRCIESPQTVANLYSGDGTFDDTVGVSALTPVNTVRFVPGLIGQAFKFTGTGSFLEGGSAACWPCAENWTESFFVKFDSIDGEMTLLDRESGSGARWRHRIFKAKDNRIKIDIGNSSAKLALSGSAPVEPGKWYHIALVADGLRRFLYVDGAPQGEVEIVGLDSEPPNRGVVMFGASKNKRAVFKGLLDEITWHEKALSADETMALAQTRDRSGCRP